MQALEGPQYLDQEVLSGAQKRGLAFERKPVERIVITGFSQTTSLGNTEETWNNLLLGESGVKQITTQNPDVQIASLLPESYDPIKTVRSRVKALGLSELSASSILLAQEAFSMADLLSEDGKIDNDKIDPRLVAGWISSGFGATDKFIAISETIQKGKRVLPSLSLQIFPEQGNGRAAGILGFSGPGGNSMEACATGASNIIEAYEKIKQGKALVAVAGGLELVPMTHVDETLEAFTALTALSKRNEDPKGASRPFDKDRDGFVIAAGGGVVILESLNHALERGATIYAEIFGAEKSMDGAPKPTEMDPSRVAETTMHTLYDAHAKALRKPDAIFAHATSTPVGDLNEAEALRQVFGKSLVDIPVTAIKSMLGHLLGGAGSVNIITAIQAFRDQKMPMIRNLETPEPEILDKGLQLIQNQALVFDATKPLNNALALAYGFGGYNATIFLGKYEEANQATI